MEIIAASEPPWRYGPPGNLARPPHRRSFETFVERLAMFSRDGVLDMGARILWYPWQKDIPPSGQVGQVVTETFGPDVIGLAMMFCPLAGRFEAEEVDFRLLSWELFDLSSFAAYESVEAGLERNLIVSRWPELLGGTSFGRLDASQLANQARGLWMRGRLLATELLFLPQVTDEAARIVLLHDALEAEAPNIAAYREFRRVYFQNHPLRLLRHAVGLIALVTPETGGRATCPGRFDVVRADEGADDVVDFTQFGRLACTSASELPAVGQQLLRLPEHERKLTPQARPLSFRPGVVLDERHECRAFFYPAPRRLLRSLYRLFINDFIDFLSSDARFVERVGVPAPSLLGSAIHRTLGAALGSNVLVIDDADCPVEGKKPDAVWCGERYGVVIEAKSRVTPRTDPECVRPDSILEAWRRCWEAVEQASEFIRNAAARRWVEEKTGRSPSVWVLAIAIDEELVAERTSFRHATSRWNRLSGTGLSGLGLVSFGCLEGSVRQLSADGFARFIERSWLESGNDGFQQPAEEPTLPSKERAPYLEQAFQRLLNGDA